MDGDEQQVFTPRRSLRLRKPSSKALENICTPTKLHKHIAKLTISTDDEDSEEVEQREKPTVLHENEIVHGDKIFTFSTSKRRKSLFDKVAEVKEEFAAQTPKAMRNKLKKNIMAKITEENESSGEDFSSSGSEYQDSETETSATTSDDSDNHSPVKKTRLRLPTSSRTAPTRKPKTNNYIIKTDDYFSNHSTKKIITSNHTLDKLETPRLPQDQLQKLLSKVELTGEHRQSIDQLIDSNATYFEKWLYMLHESFNIILYGLGSKRDVLNTFHQECLKNLPVIVVNGFFPSLTIKDVLDGIILELLELKESPVNVYEACELIEREFSYIPDTHLYLLIHNIDMIRGGKVQSVFANLAATKNIHLIASIDHINAPLIWDHSKLSKFNFTWWDVTSFRPYIGETSFECSMMVHRTGSLALSSLRNVFLSLTSNSKGIYLLIVKFQLENMKDQYYQGMAFKELYAACREAFLVSSDIALRAQLTEFVDHKMIKFKRSVDGTEYLTVPISSSLLQQFLNEQNL